MTEQKEQEAIKYIVKYVKEHDTISDDVKDIAIEALEKQIPKKPIKWDSEYICPECSADLYIENEEDYCTDCGQALDWDV